MSATRITQRVNAPRTALYRARLEPHAVATWMVPDGMTSHVHEFDAREGGCFRISLPVAQRRFRDEELSETREALKRAGHRLDVASTRNGKWVGARGGATRATLALPEAQSDDHDAVALVGAADQR
jgi:DJ-1/PfpI family